MPQIALLLHNNNVIKIKTMAIKCNYVIKKRNVKVSTLNAHIIWMFMIFTLHVKVSNINSRERKIDN